MFRLHKSNVQLSWVLNQLSAGIITLLCKLISNYSGNPSGNQALNLIPIFPESILLFCLFMQLVQITVVNQAGTGKKM